jgi:hypothetical protein
VLTHITGMTGACHCTQSWLRWGLKNYLPGLALDHDPPYLHLLNS